MPVRLSTRALSAHRLAAAALAGAMPLLMLAAPALADLAVSKSVDAVISSSAYVANTTAAYGRAMNGGSFENSTITTVNGYQYTAFWETVNVSGTNVGRVAVARRPVGAATWSKVVLSSQITNGPQDAHNIVSLGIDEKDGTLHLAYDLHGNTLRYRVSNVGVATNPTTTVWSASLFQAERSNLVTGGPAVTLATYPSFIRQPDGGLQLSLRNGSSGSGSEWIYSYDGNASAWKTDGHQIDSGFIGTYTGTTSVNSPDRNAYYNGFSYDPTGRLHATFTWREGATGSANHDLNYVYSDDNGATWRNNAGAVVGTSGASPTFYNLTSPGLIVRPLPQTQTYMNQQGQAVDNGNHLHTAGWHRDSAKDPSTDNVWEPQESSYYDTWRDDAGNWHESKVSGNVGTRPKIFFDANDNAIMIYQAVQNGGILSANNLYPTNGDLVIATASKESNWTDWRVAKVEAGPFVSEAQGDYRRLATGGVLSVVMQASPTLTGNQGTVMRSLDYTLNFTAPRVATFSGGMWSDAASWNGSTSPALNTIAKINGGQTATIDSAVESMDNLLIVGTAGSAGTLNVVDGASLNLLQTQTLNGYVNAYGGSIVVGRDGGSIGTYTQTGGTVSAWRFAVGDYYSTISGGGVSSATVSGGSLTTKELDVAFSANGSSSGSSFTVAGTANVNVDGDVILGEFGNSATLNVTGGTLTVGGDLREGFNQTNTSVVNLDGGTIDMTNNHVDVDTLNLNSGRIQNVASFRAGTVNKNGTGTVSFAGTNTFTNGIQINAGAIRVETNSALGTTAGNTVIAGGTATGRLELSSSGPTGLTLLEPLQLAGRQPFLSTSAAPHILNVAGNNTIASSITPAIGGNQYNVSSDAGTLTISGSFNNTFRNGAADVRSLNLGGAGNGVWSGSILQATTADASLTAVTKSGSGTWRLSGASSNFSGGITIDAGSLELATQPYTLAINSPAGLDIRGGSAVVLHTVGVDPGTVSLLTSGYASGFATGPIHSSAADASHGLGWSDDGAGDLRVTYALYGDADLNGSVDFSDLLALAKHYGQTSGSVWTDGDSSYDGAVDFTDLLALAKNYGGTLPSGLAADASSDASFATDFALAESLTPEPATLAAVVAIGSALLGRRRRA